ncbi:glycosyltransferase [Nocardioides xinjiangensis]|uniref:glycosyltransferase n=1 Tax=Nocardioides xinjiangensis TaxID=2817376 RepID=UPI001B30D005|nr:glycosyltransferase [Nocardioides sp. SYSU D00514]
MAEVGVVIPAHNEAATIGRTLAALRRGVDAGRLDVVVVANGCTDDTAGRARACEPPVRVLEIAQPSKVEAVRVGNAAVHVFPRVHLDADIELSGEDVLHLVRVLSSGEALAAAPRRVVPREGCSWPVRWFYDVWEELPQVASGLFGRGVVVVTAEGQRRLDALPPALGDDLAMSEAFDDSERLVVEEAVAVVHPPRTLADLVRRRIRIVTGNREADANGTRRATSRTTPGTLARLVLRQPRLAGPAIVFLAVHVAATIGAQRASRTGDTTWQRDESSRVPLDSTSATGRSA